MAAHYVHATWWPQPPAQAFGNDHNRQAPAAMLSPGMAFPVPLQEVEYRAGGPAKSVGRERASGEQLQDTWPGHAHEVCINP